MQARLTENQTHDPSVLGPMLNHWPEHTGVFKSSPRCGEHAAGRGGKKKMLVLLLGKQGCGLGEARAPRIGHLCHLSMNISVSTSSSILWAPCGQDWGLPWSQVSQSCHLHGNKNPRPPLCPQGAAQPALSPPSPHPFLSPTCLLCSSHSGLLTVLLACEAWACPLPLPGTLLPQTLPCKLVPTFFSLT